MASTFTGLVPPVLVGGLVVAVRQWPEVFMPLAAFCGLAAFSAVVGVFWAGVVLNGLAVTAAAAGAVAFVRWKSS